MKRSLLIFLFSLLLCLIGLLMIYSSSYTISNFKFGYSSYYFKHQAFFFAIGLLIMIIIRKIDYHLYYKYANVLLLFGFLLLILVLIPGIGKVRNGSRSWFGIGSLGIQPSEITKIFLVIFTAKYLSKNECSISSFKNGVLPIVIIFLTFFGLIMLEPDFGTAMVIILALLILLFLSKARISFFISIIIVGIIGVVGLIIVAPYRMQRIISYINPWVDPLGSGFQIIQSLYSIGPSGIFGKGYMNSIQKQFYLPECQTDFIFAIISEEFGLLGVLVVLLLFFLLFYNIVLLALECDDLFGKYLSLGLIIMIMIQMMMNVCVVIGLIPVTGITLPFISYGGSSLLVCMCSVGIILNIYKNK